MPTRRLLVLSALTIGLAACAEEAPPPTGDEDVAGAREGAGADAPPPAEDASAPLPADQEAGSSDAAPDDADDDAEPTRLAVSGTLRGGRMGIGGETTGWIVELAGGSAWEVDVSAVETLANALQGRLVTITGIVETREYAERGAVDVLVAESIEPLR